MPTSTRRCRNCGTPIEVSWRIPSVCRECGVEFVAGPQWAVSLAFLLAVALAVVAVVLVKLVVSAPTAVLLIVGMALGFLLFNVAEAMLFRLGVLRLRNVNATVAGGAGADALAQAEFEARSRRYARADKETRAAQAQQLREAIQLAESIRGDGSGAGEAGADESGAGAGEGRTRSGSRAGGASRAGTGGTRSRSVGGRSQGSAAAEGRSVGTTLGAPRCRFSRVTEDNEAGIRRMSLLASRIVKEHFDPIIGPEQNDYMIERFLSREAIREQIADGFEYYFVLPPKDSPSEGTGGKHMGVRPIGFVSVRGQEDGELYLSKFYLLREERGKGYSRSMMGLVRQRARKLGCDHVSLCVNRNNYQAILAYEHLGFECVGEHKTDIGEGFVMDDFVYELWL